MDEKILDILQKHDNKFEHHEQLLSAIIHAQEEQKAQIDQISINLARMHGRQESMSETVDRIAETLDRIADDITFLIRKAAEHEKDIRDLRRIK